MDDLPKGPSARTPVAAHFAPHPIWRMSRKAAGPFGEAYPLRPLVDLATCAATDAARWSPLGLPGICDSTRARFPTAWIATRKGAIQ